MPYLLAGLCCMRTAFQSACFLGSTAESAGGSITLVTATTFFTFVSLLEATCWSRSHSTCSKAFQEQVSSAIKVVGTPSPTDLCSCCDNVTKTRRLLFNQPQYVLHNVTTVGLSHHRSNCKPSGAWRWIQGMRGRSAC